ncbi:MAG TPA: AP2 domain-containing protein [Rhizomicrobium sp.]|jgi:hypothetical protein
MRTKTSRTSKTRPTARRRTTAKKKTVRKSAPSGLRNIARQEKSPKGAAGWKVSITRRGKYMYKSFADSKFGGKTRGLAAAKAWRAKMMKSTSDVDYVLWRREKRSRPNSSGIVGVGRYTVRYESSRHLVWEAYWQDADGKRHSRRFFVSVHGERGAKALACAERRQAIEDLRKELIRRGDHFD